MITLLLNPAAGNGRSKKVAKRAATYLEEKKLPFRLIETKKSGDAAIICQKLAKEAKEGDLLLTIGGDGTFSEIARGLAGSKVAVGILRAGTGNDMLKSFSVPKKTEEALDYILNREPRKMDLCLLNGEPFANESGAGFDVAVLDYAEQTKKYFKGLIPYLWGVIKTIFTYRCIHLKITADGQTILEEDCLVLSVANGRFIGGGIPISPEADPADGLLDVVIVRSCSKFRMLRRYLPGLMAGKILTFPDTSHYKAKEVTVEPMGGNEAFRVNIDGEIQAMQYCHYKIAPASLLIKM